MGMPGSMRNWLFLVWFLDAVLGQQYGCIGTGQCSNRPGWVDSANDGCSLYKQTWCESAWLDYYAGYCGFYSSSPPACVNVVESCCICCAFKPTITCSTGMYLVRKLPTGFQCQNCVAGKYNSKIGITTYVDCISCAAGTYSGPGASACSSCDAGKYSTTVGGASAAVCLSCPTGKYSTTVGGTSAAVCLSCPEGKYSTTVGGTSAAVCLSCPEGKYSTTVGGTSVAVCLSCPAGKYSSTPGSTVCIECPLNSNSPTGSSSVDACICNEGSTDST
jgi:hypothetical protein